MSPDVVAFGEESERNIGRRSQKRALMKYDIIRRVGVLRVIREVVGNNNAAAIKEKEKRITHTHTLPVKPLSP